MLALADPPTPPNHTQPDLIPGLKHSPAWHREQEDLEQAWLNAHIRQHRPGLLPARHSGDPR